MEVSHESALPGPYTTIGASSLTEGTERLPDHKTVAVFWKKEISRNLLELNSCFLVVQFVA